MTSTDSPVRLASFAVRGPMAAMRVVGRHVGELHADLLGHRSARHEDRVDPSGSDIFGDAIGHRNADRPVRDDTSHPVAGFGQHPGQHRLGDLAAKGQDVARLGFERDHLLGHPGRGVVALGHEVDAIADCDECRCRGLADGGHSGRRGNGRAVRVEHVDGRGAGHCEPVEGAGLEIRKRLLERGLVIRRCEIDERCDDRARHPHVAASRPRSPPTVHHGAPRPAIRRAAW